MFIQGRKAGVSIWFALWGRKETGFNMNLYKTPGGLKKWATDEEWKDVPVVRLGKIDFTETGYSASLHWISREEFLSQCEYLR